jgi:hypothetical protein
MRWGRALVLELGASFWTGALFWCKILRHGWLSALCRRGGQPSGELAREGGGAGGRMFGRPGLCSSCALMRNRDFIKSRGIRLMRAFLGGGWLTAGSDLWLRRRRLMQPPSHRERVAAHAATMVAPEGR